MNRRLVCAVVLMAAGWLSGCGGAPSPQPGDTSVPGNNASPAARKVETIGPQNAAGLVEVARSPEQVFPGDLTFSADGDLLLSGTALWKLSTDQVNVLPAGMPVTGTGLSPDGSQMAIATIRGLQLWDLNTTLGEARRISNQGGIGNLLYTADATRLIALCCAEGGREGGGAGKVTIFDVASGEQIAANTLDFEPRSAALSPDETALMVGGNSEVYRLDVATLSVQATLIGHSGFVSSVAYSADGTRLASGGADGTVRVWDAISGDERLALDGHGTFVEDVAVSPDGTLIASAGRDGTVRVWDTASGAELLAIHSEAASGFESWMVAVAFSPDGSRLAVAGNDGWIRVFGLR